jgi:hypothetical protein
MDNLKNNILKFRKAHRQLDQEYELRTQLFLYKLIINYYAPNMNYSTYSLMIKNIFNYHKNENDFQRRYTEMLIDNNEFIEWLESITELELKSWLILSSLEK